MGRLARLIGSLAGASMALACTAAVPALSVEAPHGQRVITCKNTASGTTWPLTIDYDRATVDSNPASIGDRWIAWRDGNDGWRYSLDLKTGDLMVVFASSMGGNTYFHRCELDH